MHGQQNIKIFENDLLPTTAVQQRQNVGAVRCRTFFFSRAAQLVCLTYFANSLVWTTIFVVGAAHPITHLAYGPE